MFYVEQRVSKTEIVRVFETEDLEEARAVADELNRNGDDATTTEE